MSNATRFAALLEPTVGDERSVDALATAPAALAELTALTHALASLQAPMFDQSASDRIRQRLVAVAAVTPAEELATAPKAGRALSWRTRKIATIGIGGLTALTAVSGVAAAASQSLPGDPFYGLKIFTEHVQLHFAGSESAKGTRELQFAATRLSELRSLGVKSPHAAALLHSMNAATTAGQTDLAKAASSSHSKAPLTQFDNFAHQQLVGLVHLVNNAPTVVLTDVKATATQLISLDKATQQLARTLAPIKILPTPPAITPTPAAPSSHPSGKPTTQPTKHPTSTGHSTSPTKSSPPSSKPTTSTTPTHKRIVPSLPLPKASSPSSAITLPSAIAKLLGSLTGNKH